MAMANLADKYKEFSKTKPINTTGGAEVLGTVHKIGQEPKTEMTLAEKYRQMQGISNSSKFATQTSSKNFTKPQRPVQPQQQSKGELLGKLYGGRASESDLKAVLNNRAVAKDSAPYKVAQKRLAQSSPKVKELADKIVALSEKGSTAAYDTYLNLNRKNASRNQVEMTEQEDVIGIPRENNTSFENYVKQRLDEHQNKIQTSTMEDPVNNKLNREINDLEQKKSKLFHHETEYEKLGEKIASLVSQRDANTARQDALFGSISKEKESLQKTFANKYETTKQSVNDKYSSQNVKANANKEYEEINSKPVNSQENKMIEERLTQLGIEKSRFDPSSENYYRLTREQERLFGQLEKNVESLKKEKEDAKSKRDNTIANLTQDRFSDKLFPVEELTNLRDISDRENDLYIKLDELKADEPYIYNAAAKSEHKRQMQDTEKELEAVRYQRMAMDKAVEKHSPSELGEKAAAVAGRKIDLMPAKITFEEDMEKPVLNEQERNVFSYLFDVEGQESANRYMEFLESRINARNRASEVERAIKLAQTLPVAATVESTIKRPIGSASALGKTIYETASGTDYIDPNSPAYSMVNEANVLRGAVRNSINGGFGRFLYDGITGIADMLTASAVGGNPATASLVMSGNAAGGKAFEAVKRGDTAIQASVVALASGTIEYITEKVGFERLAGIMTSKVINKRAIKTFLEGAISEGLEEIPGNIVEPIVDSLISGTNDIQQNQYEYIRQGVSPQDALKRAMSDHIEETLYGAAVGALSGGVMTGGAQIGGYVNAKNYSKNVQSNNQGVTPQTAYEVARQEIGLDEHDPSIYEKMQNEVQETLPPTVRYENKLQSAIEGVQTPFVENAAQATNAFEAIANTRQGDIALGGISEVGENAVVFTERGSEKLSNVTIADPSMRTLYTIATNFDSKGAANAYLGAYTGNTFGVDIYTKAYMEYYNTGIRGLSRSVLNQSPYAAVLSEDAKEIAYGMGEQYRTTLSSKAWGNYPVEEQEGYKGVVKAYTGNITTEQQNKIMTMDKLGKNIGVQFVISDSLKNANGMFMGGNKIYVGLDAVDGGVTKAASHELLHYVRQNNDAEYKQLKNIVLDAIGGEIDISQSISGKMEMYSKYGVELSEDAALEEIIADALPDVLANKDLAESIAKENPSLAKRILEWIREFIQQINETFKGTKEAEALRRNKDALVKAQKTFENALINVGVINEKTQGKSAQYSLKKTDSNGKNNTKYSLKGEKKNRYQTLIDNKSLDVDESGRILIHNADLITMEEWERFSRALNKLGFDMKGAEDAKLFYGNRGFVYNENASEALKRILGVREELSDAQKKEAINKKYAAKAARKFGTTSNYKHAGYLTINGSLLDFSEGQGYRVLDHRSISEVLDMPDDAGYSDGLIEFMNQGNVRMQSSGIDISTKPNAKQEKVLLDFFSKKNGEVIVDFSDKRGRTIHSVEYPDKTLPYRIKRDIAAFFDNGRLPVISEVERFRYSLKNTVDANADSLILENKALRETVALLKEQFRLTNGVRFNKKDVQAIARKILRDTSSKYNKTTLEGNLTKLFEHIYNNPNMNWNEIISVTADVAKGILQESKQLNKEMYEEYKDLRDYLRTTPLALTSVQRQEMASAYDGYNNFRKQLFGSVKLNNDGVALDVAWAELSEQFPALFPADLTEGEMPIYLLDATNAMKPVYENPYNMNINEAATDLAMTIYAEYQNNLREEHTFADKQKEKLDETRAKYETQIQKIRQQYKEKGEKAKQRKLGMKVTQPVAESEFVGEATAELLAAQQKRREKLSRPINKTKIITDFVDYTAPAKIIDDAAKRAGIRVNSENSLRTRIQDVAYSSDRAAAIVDTVLINPKGEIIGESFSDAFKGKDNKLLVKGADEQLFNSYLLSKHAQDRNVQGKIVFPYDVTKFVSDTERTHPEFVEAANNVHEWWRKFNQAWYVDTGFISQETFDEWNKKYPNYVPTYRVFNNQDGMKQGSKSTNKAHVKEATGSTRKIYDPIDSMISDIDRIVNIVNKNEVGRIFAEHVKNVKELEWIATPVVDSKNTESSLAKKVDSLINDNVSPYEAWDKVQEFHQSVLNGTTKDSNVITIRMEDGTLQSFEVHDKMIFDLMQTMGVEKANGINSLLNVFGKVTRTMAQLTTGSNPLFAIPNFVRDFQQAVTTGSFASNYVTGMYKWIKAFAEYCIQKSPDYKLYQAMGASNTRFQVMDSKTLRQQKNLLFSKYAWNSGVKNAAAEVGGKLFKTITMEALNNKIENATRFAEFKYGKHDLNTYEGRLSASKAAHDVTVNFRIRGKSGLVSGIMKVVPFINPGLQGLNKTTSMFTKDQRGRLPARLSKLGFNALIAGAASMALFLKYSDEEEKEAYAKLPARIKLNHWIIPTGDKVTPFIRIPLPQDTLFKALYSVGLWGVGNIENAPDGFTEDLATIGFDLIEENPISSILNNGITAPIVALQTNKNWFGGNIVSPTLQNLPIELQYDDTTADLFVRLSNISNSLGIQVSPKGWEYAVKQYTGYFGQVVIPSISKDKYTGEENGLEAVWDNAIRRFTVNPAYTNDVTDVFYGNARKVQENYAAWSKKGMIPMLDPNLSDGEKLEAANMLKIMNSKQGAFGQTKDFISGKYDEIDSVMTSDLSKREKDEKVVDLRMEIVRAAQKGNEEYAKFAEQYTGKSMVSVMMGNHAVVEKPNARNTMIPAYKADEEKPYMKTLIGLYDKHGLDYFIPTAPSYNWSDGGKEVNVSDDMKDALTMAYKATLEKEVDMDKKWSTYSSEEAKKLIGNAKTKAGASAKLAAQMFNAIDDGDNAKARDFQKKLSDLIGPIEANKIVNERYDTYFKSEMLDDTTQIETTTSALSVLGYGKSDVDKWRR